GNVFEWCSDWYGNYDNNSIDKPKGPASGIEKVIRGGCFDSDASECKVKVRFSNLPASSGDGLGFRIVSQD
ncbi:MAG: SUMF1/EgtB/PvdO family nonheme iron enzyme, partial [Ignavibacteriae bacterium]|nr:SUMF1/EgtB/PvdO family nonheme iron enzyme [Ignavibacteriota bacterium]